LVKLNRIQSANCTDAVVAQQHLLPQVPGIGSQPPFMNAIVTAERSPAAGHLTVAPAANAFAVRSPLLCFADPASRHFPLGAHYF